MGLLDLQLGEPVQGVVELRELNLMLVFQVNCPGCLSQALPLSHQLANKYPDLNLFALSTAFEDFNLNTLDNTRALVADGQLCQNSARYFAQLGQKKLPYRITIPVVMDWFLSAEKVAGLPGILLGGLERDRLSSQVEAQLANQLRQRLEPVARTGRTFLNNQFQGTPSWVLFDRDRQILEQWFGHKPAEWVELHLQRHLN